MRTAAPVSPGDMLDEVFLKPWCHTQYRPWFQRKAASAGAEIIEFSVEKVKFANDVATTLDRTHFEAFKPIFEFIKSKCAEGVPA